MSIDSSGPSPYRENSKQRTACLCFSKCSKSRGCNADAFQEQEDGQPGGGAGCSG